MAYRILYVDNGDVVAEEAAYGPALKRLLAFVAEHPHLSDEIGIQEFDGAGMPVGELSVGLEVVGQQLAL